MDLTFLAPEIRILLLAAGGPENDAEIRALLRRGIEFPKLRALANLARATLPLRRRLAGLTACAGVGKAVREMTPAAQVDEFRMLHLETRLHRLLDLYRRAGIDVLLLKGAGLAYTVYGSFTARPMNDLDLLVAPERAGEAWRLAQGHGWNWNSELFPLASYESHHHLPPLDDASHAGVRLEIHREPHPRADRLAHRAEDLWRSARSHEINGHPVRVPDLCDQVLHTCIHFAWSHHFTEKAWLTVRDVWRYAGCDGLDWDRVVARARSTRAETCVYWTLRLAGSAANVRVPHGVAEALAPRLPARLLRLLERHYALGLLPGEIHCPSLRVQRTLWRLGVQRGAGEEHLVLPAVAASRRPEQARAAAKLTRHVEARSGWWRYLRVALGGR